MLRQIELVLLCSSRHRVSRGGLLYSSVQIQHGISLVRAARQADDLVCSAAVRAVTII